MYQIFPTKKFIKSLDKLVKNQGVNRVELYDVLGKLSRKEKLEPKYRDHNLKGNLSTYRECHIHNDILLLYYYNEAQLVLVAANIGTHSQLF